MANYYNKDLYKTLGLTFQASQAEIKSAFRKLARKYHPDVATSDSTAEKFKEIKEAYDILSDEESRKKYDVLHGYYQDRLRREYEEKQRKKSQEYSEYIARARQRAQNETDSLVLGLWRGNVCR